MIPANDDSAKSIEVILDACIAAINEGLEERKVEKADTDAAAVSQKDGHKAEAEEEAEEEEVAEEAPVAEAEEEAAE